jgi:hypothetical protein
LTPSHSSVTLTSSSAGSYLWSNGSTARSIIASSAGSYRVTTTAANGCKATSNQIVVRSADCTPPAAPFITVNGASVIADGQSVQLTSSAGEGYLWSTGESTRTITVTRPGNYTVRLYNGGGCYSTSLPAVISVVSSRLGSLSDGASDTDISQPLSVYPNPATSEINLRFSAATASTAVIRLNDAVGKEILNMEIVTTEGENNYRIDVNDLPRGIYFASLFNHNEKQMVKVIVE